MVILFLFLLRKREDGFQAVKISENTPKKRLKNVRNQGFSGIVKTHNIWYIIPIRYHI